MNVSGNSGLDELAILGGDTTWRITGNDTGQVGEISFTGIGYLIGGADNNDTFMISQGGRLTKGLAGGDRGFDTLVLEDGVYDQISYFASSPDAGTIQRGVDLFAYSGLEPIYDYTTTTNRIFGLTNGNDTDTMLSDAGGGLLTLSGSTFEDITFSKPSVSLTIQGLAGNDTITLNSMNLGSTSLTVEAEHIFVQAGQVIDSTTSITLKAAATGSITGGVAAVADLSAQVLVNGSIRTTGQLTFDASIDNVVRLSQNATEGTLIIISSTLAQAEIGSGAYIEAGTLAVTAATNNTLTAAVIGANSGGATINATQGTFADIQGGAVIKVGTGQISGDETASILVRAVDKSDIQTSVNTSDNTLTSITGFDAVTSNITLNRNTVAYIGSGASNVTIAGLNGSSTGKVKVDAETRNGDLGGVYGNVVSSLIGTHHNTITKDDSLAWVNRAGMAVTALEVTALNSSACTAIAKVSDNKSAGETTASILASTVSSLTPASDQGIIVTAATESVFTARSDDFQANIWKFPSIELGKASASNEVNMDIAALVINSSLTATSGTIAADALNKIQMEATAKALTVVDTQSILPIYSLNLGGTYAWNEATGNVIAAVTSSSLYGSDVDVISVNRSAVDATAEASTSVSGGSNSAVGVSVAFNAIGWDVSGLLGASMDALIGTSLTASEKPVETKAYIIGSTVDAGGNLSVLADSLEQINATVSNVAESTASALYGASGMSAGAVIASNRVSSAAEAFVEDARGARFISADGSAVIRANDAAGIYSNVKLTASSTTGNDGGSGLLKNAVARLAADYRSFDGSKNLKFGDLIWVDDDYKNGGNGGQIYKYMGVGATVDLGTADYSDADYWQQSPATSLFPQGYNISSSNSMAFGGAVARNEVNSAVRADITNATITSGALTVEAIEDARIHAIADTETKSSGGSAFGTGKSLAVNGVVSTNLVLSNSDAHITNSNVITSGDVTVHAENSSTIDATTKSIVTTSADAFGVMLAFNTIGWGAQNVLFSAIDALIGTNIGNEQPTSVKAYIANSSLTAGGDLSVTAESAAMLTADVSNDASSAASALFDATGKACGGVLASNMVNSSADAYIDFSGSIGSVNTSGDITVSAMDTAGIDATSMMKAISSTTNDGGASLLGGLVDSATDGYDYTSNSGTHTLIAGQRVRAASDYEGGGVKGGTYLYIGDIYDDVDLGTEDYSDGSNWLRVNLESLSGAIPAIGNLTGSDSMGVGGLVVRNDVRSRVTSNIDNTKVTSGGDIFIIADEKADILASTEGIVSSSGGSAFGEGQSLAINAMIATNLVLSSAKATVTNSEITSGKDLNVNAGNTSGIDATVDSATTSSDTAVGVTLAFNTLGWKAQNVLFNAIDALIGTNIGNEQPASVEACILDTTVHATGDVSVIADNSAQLNATLSNAASSTASALFNASGKAASALLSSNMVSSKAIAYIDFSGSQGTVQAVGTVTVKASDDAGIYSNVKLVSSSVTSNNGGVSVLKNVMKGLEGVAVFDYLSSDGEQSVKFGDRVRLAQNYENGGNAGSLYKYMGTDGDVDLSQADYSDSGYWLEISPTKMIPEGLNLTDSDSMAIGALVVRNDLRSVVDGHIKNSVVTAGGVAVEADESAIVKATNNSEAESSGGSAFGEGQSLAINGVIATNLVLSSANATINGSNVTTGNDGDVTVTALNTSYINAKNISLTTSGDTGVTLTLAFNTVGWKAQNILFQTVDTLIGASAIGDEQPAVTKALITDSTINAAGDVSVNATSKATIRSTVSNETESKSEGITGASSLAIGATLASNLVKSDVSAVITSAGVNLNINSTGGVVSVLGQDDASINSNCKLAAISSTKNDAGLSLIYQAASDVLGITYTDRSGSKYMKSGDMVLVDDFDYTTSDDPKSVSKGDRVKLEFDFDGGAAGDLFEYVGSDDLTDSINLQTEDYADATKWRKVEGDGSQIYKYIGSRATVDLGAADYSGDDWIKMISIDPTKLIPGLNLNISDSSSSSFGGLIVRNDVRSSVDAHTSKVNVTAGKDVVIKAIESAAIRAQDDSTVTSSGGSMFGKGTSMALNAVIVTNLVQSSANAYATDSSITSGNDVVINGKNSSLIDAKIASNVESNGYSIGVTLAFNTIGWNAQNVLFNAIDTLAGGVFGGENPAEVKAYTANTNITALGAIDVRAISDATIDAKIISSNASLSVTPAGGSTTIAVGLVLTMNKVSTEVLAKIGSAATLLASTGDITVKSDDTSKIDSVVKASSLAVAAGVKDSTSVSVGLALARNEIRNNLQVVIQSAGSLKTAGGDVIVSADKDSKIIYFARSKIEHLVGWEE